VRERGLLVATIMPSHIGNPNSSHYLIGSPHHFNKGVPFPFPIITPNLFITETLPCIPKAFPCELLGVLATSECHDEMHQMTRLLQFTHMYDVAIQTRVSFDVHDMEKGVRLARFYFMSFGPHY